MQHFCSAGGYGLSSTQDIPHGIPTEITQCEETSQRQLPYCYEGLCHISAPSEDHGASELARSAKKQMKSLSGKKESSVVFGKKEFMTDFT